MGRPQRAAEARDVYHVLNRANARMALFADQGDYEAFERVFEHFFTVARYVERIANLSRRAEAWKWCSLYRSLRGSSEDRQLLAAWPLPRKANWVDHVNAPQRSRNWRRCVTRGKPFGDDAWSLETIDRLGLESTLSDLTRCQAVE